MELNALHLVPIGFVTWFATGLDDIIIMSVLLKGKIDAEKGFSFFGHHFFADEESQADPIWLLIGHLLAVAGLLLLAGLTSNLVNQLTDNPLAARLPGVVIILFGLFYLWRIHVNHQKERARDVTEPVMEEHNWKLFASGFLMYAAASGIDDYMVNTSIMIQQTTLFHIFMYAGGFLIGSIVSFYLATKISHFLAKISAIDYVAALFLIVIGSLILSGVQI